MKVKQEYDNNNYQAVVKYITQISFVNRSFNQHYYYIKSLNRLSKVQKSIPYAVSIAKGQIDDIEYLKILYELIWAYHKEGEWNKAEEQIDSALKITKKLTYSELSNEKRQVITAFINLTGIVYYSQGKLELAMSSFKKLLEFEDEIQSDKMIQGTKINISLIKLDRGNYLDAINYLLEALELAEQNDYRPHIRVASNNLAYIYTTIGDLHKAEDYAQITLNIVEEMDDKWGLALISNTLGQIMFKRGNYEEAMYHLDQNHKLMREFGNSEYILRGLFYKLLIHLDLKNRFDANEIIQEMKSYVDTTNNARFELILQLSHAIYLKHSGLYRNKVEAETKLKRLINLYSEIESEHITYAYLFLIELLLEQLFEMQSRSHDKYERLQEEEEVILIEIEKLSEHTFEIAKQQNVPELKLQVHYINAHLAILRIDIEKMYYHLKEAKDIAKQWGIENVTISDPNLVILELDSEPLPVKLVGSINDIIHSLPRLKIMIALSKVTKITFTELQEIVDLSSGNLSNHCKILIDQGYVNKRKEIVVNKFQTMYSLTNKGIQAFDSYTSKLKTFLKG